MTATTTARVGAEAPPAPSWRPFRVTVARKHRLSPSFLRLTFTGSDLDEFGHDGPDQRLKLYIPRPGSSIPEWAWANWRRQGVAADPTLGGVVRTYTIRSVRPEAREVDVDFVLHGPTGPASVWAEQAEIGQEIALVGPNRLHGADCRGHEWRPPAGARDILIAGDETAVPAVAAILEALRHRRRSAARLRVFLEVPEPADLLGLAAPDHAEITWLPRVSGNGTAAPNGALLVEAVRAARFGGAGHTADASSLVDTIDIDVNVLWEIADGGNAREYAWVAGEAGAVKAIRRHLVDERGVDKRAVTFMGYWRLGRSLR